MVFTRFHGPNSTVKLCQELSLPHSDRIGLSPGTMMASAKVRVLSNPRKRLTKGATLGTGYLLVSLTGLCKFQKTRQ